MLGRASMPGRRSPEGDEQGTRDSRLDDTLVGLATRSLLSDEDSQEFTPGSKVGRYVVLEQVGRGGMGVVLGAFDPQLNRKIALKLLHTRRHREGSRSSGSARQRLLREAQAIAKLSHPNVISVYDVGTIGEGIYVAMEFVEGCTLTVWLEQHKRRHQEVVEVFLQAGRGLAAAHAAGLVHRDFKPDNVLVGLDGQVRVSDFGLARADPSQVGEEPSDAEEPLEESTGVPQVVNFDDSDVLSSPLTQAGVVVGTPRYMAPEQHAGAHADARSDQFAFCVTLYQGLYGQDPYVAHTLERLALAKQDGRICEVPAQSRVPAYLEDIVMRGLAPDPIDRFPSMEDLVAALERDPAAWRQRFVIGGIGVAVAVIVGFGVRFSPAAEESECRPAGADAWRGVWDRDRKDALRQGLQAVAPQAGAKSWAAIEPAIDGFTGQWLQMRIAACEGARGAPAEGRGPVALQLRCLERQQRALQGMLGVAAEASEPTVARIPRMLEVMPELELCESREFVLAQPLPPREVQVEATVEAVRTKLDRVAPLAAIGRHEDALEVARRALDEAQASGDAPVLAEAHYAHGLGLVATGQLGEAERSLSQAVWTATRAQHDAYVALGADALVDVVGNYRHHFREGVLWEELARSTLGRLALEGIPVADLDHSAGRLALQMGELARARTYVERAIAVRETVRGPQDRQLARWWVDHGDIVLYAGDPESARASYEKARILAESVLDDDHPTRAFVAWGLGRVGLDHGDHEVARAQLEAAVAILKRNRSAADPDLLQCTVDLAAALDGLEEHQAALELLHGVWTLSPTSERDPQPYVVGAAAAAADLERRLGHLDAAMMWLKRAQTGLSQCERPEVRLVASVETVAAQLRLNHGDLAGAFEGFDAAARALAAQPEHDRKRAALARFLAARVSWQRDGSPEAIDEVERARAALEAEGSRGREGVAAIDAWLEHVRAAAEPPKAAPSRPRHPL